MANTIKARCKCGYRATIIRTEFTGNTAILTARCDNRECQRIFMLAMEEYKEVSPPLTAEERQEPGFVQTSF